MSSIKDPDVRKALDTLQDEFENMEENLKDKDGEIEDLQNENEKLKVEVSDLQQQVKELEEALAEAYLTDEVDDGIQGEDVELSPGCGSDVSDSAGDKAVN